MKTNKTLFLAGLIALILTGIVLSCNTPIALGDKLDVIGPVVDFTYPEARTAVLHQFIVKGSVSDRSRIKELRLTAEINGNVYAKQWRYFNGNWEVSQDYGASWQPLENVTFSIGADAGARSAQWDAAGNSVDWEIPVDMSINGAYAPDGEYLFILQAWDSGNFSDDGSYKTRVYIIDKDPPLVSVTNPLLYVSSYTSSFSNTTLQELHSIGNDDDEKTDPAFIGKFLTQAFALNWQIEENVDIKTIDLRFYLYSEDIDGIEETDLPGNYIFRYSKDIPANELSAINNVKPNGMITVPALNGPASTGNYDGGEWELKSPISEKTTIKVVALCFDAANNVNIDNPLQEKVLGYFVYWPAADVPWIAFPEGMEKLSYYGSISDPAELEEATYMIYPGRKIRATAFHAYGLKEVIYTLYNSDESKAFISTVPDLTNVRTGNDQKPNGGYSTILPWDFEPPARSGYFLLKAQAFSTGNQSEEYEMLFRVQDITFPNFPVEPSPAAGEPLYMEVKGSGASSYITISGYVSDATEVSSLCMAWINPNSRNYAAMSQLQYFRDSSYKGWADALNLSPGATGTEPNVKVGDYPYDPGNPNRLWKLVLGTPEPDLTPEYTSDGKPKGVDLGTGEREATYRQLYKYTVDVPLSQMNINVPQFLNLRYLESQIFLLRVENPDGKTTIITYAPQGDVLSPKLEFTSVTVEKGSNTTICEPGKFQQVPQFTGGEKITVKGTWIEDSTGFLDLQNYFYNKMAFSINERPLTPGTGGVTITMTPANGNATSGSFEIVANVGTTTSSTLDAVQSYMKDTLVVGAYVIDIGGNPSEVTASWLVESDTLKFLRISSDYEDTAYKAGDTIEIFMEFNKAVKLKDGRVNDPVLVLDTGGIARYKSGQINENVRQYFEYTVAAGHNTLNLNVTGISINGGTTVINTLTNTSTNWQAANYPFAWVHTPAQGSAEEVRLTMDSRHNQLQQGTTQTFNSATFYPRTLPVSANSPGTDNDYVFTLKGGKRLSVDTTGPVITSFTVSPTGWHGAGVELNITATFNENVRLGSPLPYLILGTGNATEANRRTSTTLADIRVSNDRITFKYVVKAGDTTGTNALTVTGFGGQILDIPGTAMTATVTGTLAGLYLDTTAPAAPTVTVYSTANQTGTAIGASNGTRALGNLYHEAISVRVAAVDTGDQHLGSLGRIEYSFNNGTNWTSSPNATININDSAINNGSYTVIARQTDQAGNTSANSPSITFNLDRGTLISDITSFTTNGDYTYNTNRTTDDVNITVNLRKPLVVSAASVTLNVTPVPTNVSPTPQTITAGTIAFTPSATAVSQLTFTYRVGSNQTTGTNNKLNVSGLTITATDGGATVPASALAGSTSTTIADLNTASKNLGQQKSIYIVTGALSRAAPVPVFSTGTTDLPSGVTGGLQTDGTYNTTLVINFNRNIIKGNGNVIVRQIAGTAAASYYRLPAVLTEAQRNKYRDVIGFDTYYKRGTNGITSSGTGGNTWTVDTSTKFILIDSVDTAATANAPSSSGTAIQQFAERFRQAEAVTLSANSNSVRLDGSKLMIDLTGTNALQVPGAQYEVLMDAGFVQDSLGFTSSQMGTAGDTFTVAAIGGIAKPFIRVNKPQDAVGTGTGANNPRLIVTNASDMLQTTARFDCRTPNSTVRYIATTRDMTYSTSGLGSGNGSGNWNRDNIPDVTSNLPARPAAPAYNTGVTTNPASLGDTNYQGYIWRARAAAFVTSSNTGSAESEEMAFRTVLTYEVNGMTGGAPGQSITSASATNQIWIRGGNQLEVSTIPGFPLTWEDDWNVLKADGKRAGIKLMTQSSGSGNTSTWKWVTWEINVPAYFDMVLGMDTNDANGTSTNTAAVCTQYGPRQWAMQRSGWTSYKAYYRMLPGEHRWLYVNGGTDYNSKGGVNFSGTFSARPAMTANGDVTWTP